MKKKLWGGRFAKQVDSDVERYTASITFDQELALEDILGSLAHASMLAHCGIITEEEQQQLQKGLKKIAEKIVAGDVQFAIEDEDIHMNIERLLSTEIGDVAGKLHTARSRNDQVALDIHLYLRKEIIVIVDLLTNLQTILLQLAKQHQKTILPGYTHLQRAQPIYLAQHFLAYVAMLQRDVERLCENWRRVNQLPLGACALAGTSFPTDRHFTAKLLSFDSIYLNTLDAVSDRDFLIEFLSHGSLIMLHLSRLSEELILWSSQEFNFITFDDAYCTGSSIMPQKKNPDVVELGRGKTGRVYGSLLTLLTLLKGLPLAYNKDLQEDKEPLFDTVKTLKQTLAIYAPLLATLKINEEVMWQAANQGYLNATILAEYLVKQGMTFRHAHEVVGKMVAYAIEQQCRLEDLSLTQMQQFSPLISEKIYDVLAVDFAAAVCNQKPNYEFSLLEQQFLAYEQAVSQNQHWLNAKNEMLQQVCVQIGLDLYGSLQANRY